MMMSWMMMIHQTMILIQKKLYRSRSSWPQVGLGMESNGSSSRTGMGLLMESSSQIGQAGNYQWSYSFQAGLGLVMESSSRASLAGNFLNNPKCSSQAGSSLVGLAGNYLMYK